MSEGVLPIITVISPNNPTPDSEVTVTVSIQSTVGGRALTITSSPSGYFSNIPSTVTVPDDAEQVQFEAKVSATASGQGSVTASANGGQAQGTCVVTI